MCCGIWMAGRGRKRSPPAGPVSREKLHRAGAVRRGAGDGTLELSVSADDGAPHRCSGRQATAVLKPSEDAPRTSAVIASLLEEILSEKLPVWTRLFRILPDNGIDNRLGNKPTTG